MENQRLTSAASSNQLAPRNSTNEAGAIMRRFEQLSELTGWAGILHAVAQDKRHDLAPHVIELWKVKLAPYRDDDIAQVLLRGEWKFFPSVDEVTTQLDRIAEARYFAREEERTRNMLEENRAARESQQDPAAQAEHARLVRELGERLVLRRMTGIARRSPENVRALSQAKVLRQGGRRAA